MAIDKKFISRLSLAFCISSTVFTIASICIYVRRPTQPNYISSVLPPQYVRYLLLPFAIYELLQYVGNWCAVIFYMLFASGYFYIMASWLDELR